MHRDKPVEELRQLIATRVVLLITSARQPTKYSILCPSETKICSELAANARSAKRTKA